MMQTDRPLITELLARGFQGISRTHQAFKPMFKLAAHEQPVFGLNSKKPGQIYF